jgi:eukaryotic-like serine/threonine-protein kinase
MAMFSNENSRPLDPIGFQLMPTAAELDAALPSEITVVRQIGGGGQREVFLVDTPSGPAVLKVMDPNDRDRALRELSAGSTFNHPNLVRVLDTDVHDITVAGSSYCYFLEEYVDGQMLSALTLPMDACEVLKLLRGLVGAIEHLWTTHRIVHRDINPKNIIRRQSDGEYVLLDVGIGRHQLEPSLTAPLAAPGTMGYYSPEQINPTRRNVLDHRSDLFLAGIAVYYCLESALPFDPTRHTYVDDLVRGNVRPYVTCPAEIQPLLDRLLALRPHARFGRFAQLYKAIDDARRALQCS